MISKNKYLKKITPLLLLLLILIPINVLFFGINTISTSKTNDFTEDGQNDIIKDTPNPSLVDNKYELKINSSVMYPNGTRYIFHKDYLYFELLNTTLVSNVRLIIPSLTINQAFSQTGNKFDLTHYFSVAAGTYDAYVSFWNATLKTVKIEFNIKVTMPGPQILRVWATDSYQGGWIPLYEAGYYSTYRNTDIEFIVETYNREALVSAVSLNYTDGISNNLINADSGVSSGNRMNYTFQGGKAIPVYMDQANPNRWKLELTPYKFVFNASYGGAYYLFEFYLEILNKPPEITMFEIDPHITENPQYQETTITVKANASDFEDDYLWYQNTERDAKYSDRVNSISTTTGCSIASGSVSDLEAIDGNGIDLDFQANQWGEFWMNAQLNPEINISKVDWFGITVRLKDDLTPAYSARLEVFNFQTTGWEVLSNLSVIVASSWTNVHNSSNALGAVTISDYIPEENATMRFRIRYARDSSPANVQIDYVNVTTNLKRRETFSRIVLQLFNPLGVINREVELVNCWDSNKNYYWYRTNISNILSNYGTWTARIRFIDHAAEDFLNVVWGNFSGTSSSSPKKTYNYNWNLNNPDFIDPAGQAMATKTFALGIKKQDALNLTGGPNIFPSSWETTHDQDLQFNMVVNGIDSSNLNSKVYSFRRNPSDFLGQYNYSDLATTNDSTTAVNVDGTKANLTTNGDNEILNITLTRDLGANQRIDAVLWTIQLYKNPGTDPGRLRPSNVSNIFIHINNWFNDTSLFSTTYLEFWNYTSGSWGQPNTGSWTGGALYTTQVNQMFNGEVSNSQDLTNFISSSGVMKMRLRIAATNPGIGNDIKLLIDYMNFTVNYTYNYLALLTLQGASSLGQSETTLKLIPTANGPTSIIYSISLNINDLGLEPDVFTIRLAFSNGNSTIEYSNFRIAPRVIKESWVTYYYYDKAAEISYLTKNFTLSILEPDFTLSPTVIYKNKNTADSTVSDEILLIRNRDRLRLNASLDIGTLSSTNLNFLYQMQVKQGRTEEPFLWDKSGTNIDGLIYSKEYTIDDTYDYDQYWVRFYTRSPTGRQYATEWQEFRVVNFQPVAFAFTFDHTAKIQNYRGDRINFDFSFLDYDLTSEYSTDKVHIRFLINNKSNGNAPEWLDAVVDTHDSYSAQRRHTYNCHLDIPFTVQTTSTNMSYWYWQFWVDDSISIEKNPQDQISFLNYNQTEWVVINRQPSIDSLTLNGFSEGVQIERHNNVSIRFDINDGDEVINNGLNLEVAEFNISTPAGMYDYELDNTSIGISVGGGYRFYTYYINRSSVIDRYNISILVIDSDGATVLASTYFYVINGIPWVEDIWFDPSSVKRNLDGFAPDYAPVKFYVNVSDKEDSWFGNNFSDSVSLTIQHKNPYKTSILEKSSITPIVLSMTPLYCGNNTNGHIETWMATYQFNETVGGDKFYAGELSLFANVTDGEGDSGTKYGTQDFILENYAPQKHKIKDADLDMDESAYYYVKESVAHLKDINVYIFVSDKEGLSMIKLWYFPYTGEPGQELRGSLEVVTLESDEWDEKLMSTEDGGKTTIYRIKITIKYDRMPENVRKIEINDLIIYDDDYEFKDDSDYGATFVRIDDIKGVEITFTGESPGQGDPIVVYIAMIVGLGLLGVIVVVGVLYYRKRTGYRKFLD